MGQKMLLLGKEMKVRMDTLNCIAYDIFVIAKGESYVSIKDTQKREYKNFKKLAPGEHFGVTITNSKII